MKNRSYQIEAKIIKNIAVAPKYCKILLSASPIANSARPGQFVQIKVADSYEPLLRRPFSIHRVRGPGSGGRGQIEILYEVVGPGTEILSKRRPGEHLDIIGPLGNGFDYPLSASATTRSWRAAEGEPRPVGRDLATLCGGMRYPLLVTGGMGVAPLIFLAEKLAQLNTTEGSPKRAQESLRATEGSPKRAQESLRAQYVIRNTVVLIGAKTKNQILCEKEFKDLGCEVQVATDDGSKGFKGYVSDLLKHLLPTMDYRLRTIYACGPLPMLQGIGRISQKYNIPAQVSLEAHMACGIGACLGCVIKIRNTTKGSPKRAQESLRAQYAIRDTSEYKRVCKDGPVFNADEVVW